jgi:hypothetical protein
MGFGLYVWYLGQHGFKLLQTSSFRTFSQVLDRHEGGHFLGDRSGDELLKGGPIR